MGDSGIHPSLKYVTKARELALNKDYEASIKIYEDAKAYVQREVDNCSDVEILKVWNTILKDIIDEQNSVEKVSKCLDDVVKGLKENSIEPPKGHSDPDGGEEVVLPSWTNEESGTPRVLSPPVRRPNVFRNKFEKVANKAQPINKAPGLAFKKFSPRPVASNDEQVNRNARASPDKAKQHRASLGPGIGVGKKQQAKQVVAKGASKANHLDPATNPLVKQIIDMGILVKEPNVQWDSIAGLEDVKKVLKHNLVMLPMRPDIAKGLLTPWKSILFYGPPGTGKTFLAKAVATECKRTFFNITSATITSRFLGESEKLVGHLFALAEQMGPSTIFFDEIDSVASQRGGHNEGEASRRIKAELLTKLEGVGGTSDENSVFVLAATNFPWDLDEALLRRFQKRIFIPLPDFDSRLSILQKNIHGHTSDDFDFIGFAKKLEGYSCADITNLCRDAIQAVFDRKTAMLDTQQFLNMPAEEAKVILSNADFEQAMRKRRSSVDHDSLKRYEEWKSAKGAE